MATLESINEDVLYIICEHVAQVSERSTEPIGVDAIWDMPGQFPSTVDGVCKELTAMQSFSMASRYFRDFSAPWIFRHITIKGRREEVVEVLDMMKRNLNSVKYTR